jgi:phosphoribosylanthranilate isomerase
LGLTTVMVKVKICGITNAEDARQAVAAGADALGFVFFSQSPRAVNEAQVREIVSHLPPFVTRVGLFVNADAEQINRTMQACQLDLAQLHGDEPPELFSLLDCRAIKALRVRSRGCLLDHQRYPGSALLLDAWCPDRYGGTGEKFDWELAEAVARQRPVVLAGGLNPENVAAAIRAVRPYAVDVSSGVETAPGRKDLLKLRHFIRNAKDTTYDL